MLLRCMSLEIDVTLRQTLGALASVYAANANGLNTHYFVNSMFSLAFLSLGIFVHNIKILLCYYCRKSTSNISRIIGYAA